MSRDLAIDGWRSLFDGSTLDGWHRVPRLPTSIGPGWPEPDPQDPHIERATVNQAMWVAEDGMIVGAQRGPGGGYGGYLLTNGTFRDFELELEARPDWPADTGMLLRATRIGSQGYQVLLDHRRSGGIGGLYGNGIGGFHALGFTIDVARDSSGHPTGLKADDPATSVEPISESKRRLLRYAATLEEFLSTWKWGDWNRFRILCVGEHPVISVWINDVLISECDTLALPTSVYDRGAVKEILGDRGHIALEVHDNDLYRPPGAQRSNVRPLGPDRWGPGAVCRWRDIRIREIDSGRPGEST